MQIERVVRDIPVCGVFPKGDELGVDRVAFEDDGESGEANAGVKGSAQSSHPGPVIPHFAATSAPAQLTEHRIWKPTSVDDDDLGGNMRAVENRFDTRAGVLVDDRTG